MTTPQSDAWHGWPKLLSRLGDISLARALRYREKGIFGRAHSHVEQNHLLYLVDAIGTVVVDGTRHAVSTDTVLFVRAGRTHSSTTDGRRMQDEIEIRFALPSGIGADALPPLPSVFRVRRPAAVQAAFERIVRAFLLEPQPDTWLTRVRLVETLMLLERDRQLMGRQAGQGGRAAQRVGRALDHIALHYAEPLSVADLARKADMSPSHFSACFRDVTGSSPVEHLVQTRLRHARQLLRSSHLKVKEVAENTGFSSTSYFCRVFSARTGMSPGAYRQKQQ